MEARILTPKEGNGRQKKLKNWHICPESEELSEDKSMKGNKKITLSSKQIALSADIE